MKRLTVMFVMIVLVMPLARAQARRVGSGVLVQHGGKTYLYPDRGGYSYYGGRVDYGYGCYARGDVHSSYPSGSLLSSLIGVPTYNDEQYWAYQNRILDLGEKGLDRQSGEQSYVKDQKLLSEANQRGKLQKLEEENAKLKNQLTEMHKEVLELRQMLQEFMKQNQSKK